jgi:methionine-rich copper-binding protein CopC
MEISVGMAAPRGLRRAIGFRANMPNSLAKINLRTLDARATGLTLRKLTVFSERKRRSARQLMKNYFSTLQRPLLRIVLLVAFAFLLAAPREALAHARLLKSSPKDGETIKAPEQLEFWFSELLDSGGFNKISVFPAAELKSKTHTSLTKGEPKIDSKDQTHLTIDLSALPPGEYVVDWRVLSLDGHSAPGRFKFKVGEPKTDSK